MINDVEQKVKIAAIVVTAILLLQLIWGVTRVFSVSTPEAVLPTPASLRANLVQNPVGTAEEANEIVGRPVFWEGRQAFISEGTTVPEPSIGTGRASAKDPINKAKLLGLYTGGEKRGVIVAFRGEKTRVLEGDDLDGWILKYMSSDQAVFEQDGSRHTVKLEHAAVSAEGGARATARPGAAKQAAQKRAAVKLAKAKRDKAKAEAKN